MKTRWWLGVAGSACVLACAACGASGSQDPGSPEVDDGGGAIVDAAPPRDARSAVDAAHVDAAPPDLDASEAIDSGVGKDAGNVDAGYIVLPPHQAHALVGGGTTSESPHYRMTHSLSQAPGGNNTQSSRDYRLFGGLVGATQ